MAWRCRGCFRVVIAEDELRDAAAVPRGAPRRERRFLGSAGACGRSPPGPRVGCPAPPDFYRRTWVPIRAAACGAVSAHPGVWGSERPRCVRRGAQRRARTGTLAATCPGRGWGRAGLSAAPRHSTLPTPGGAVCQIWSPWQAARLPGFTWRIELSSVVGGGAGGAFEAQSKHGGGVWSSGSVKDFSCSLSTQTPKPDLATYARRGGVLGVPRVPGRHAPSCSPPRAGGAQGLTWALLPDAPKGPAGLCLRGESERELSGQGDPVQQGSAPAW